MIDSQIFEALKAKAEEDSQVSEELSTRTKALDRDVAYAQGLLSRIHSTPKTNREFSSRSSLLSFTPYATDTNYFGPTSDLNSPRPDEPGRTRGHPTGRLQRGHSRGIRFQIPILQVGF